MPQTTFLQQMPKGFPGMIADTGPSRIDTGFNANASLSIPCGVFVKDGSSDDSAVDLLGSSSDKIAGITCHTHVGDFDYGTPNYKPGAEISLGTFIRVWMQAEVAVAKNDPVYARYANNGGNTKTGRGTVGNIADSGSALRVWGARFVTSASAGGLVVVEFSRLLNDAALAASAA
jgi:hypothetical protein